MNREDALKHAEEPIDFTGATVEQTPRRVKMTYSFRLREQDDEALAHWLEEEAGRRGVGPTDLVRDLLNEARLRATQGEDRVITVRTSVLHRMIESIADRPAA